MQACHFATSLLKRWLMGTHAMAMKPKHLQAYFDEFAFRYNRRKTEGVARIAAIMAAKKTSELIPLCHPLLLGDIKVELFGDGSSFAHDKGAYTSTGYVFIMGRTDDVINVAGHRLSTGSMEAVVAAHPAVAECAVIGVPDPDSGEAVKAFIVKEVESLTEEEVMSFCKQQLTVISSTLNLFFWPPEKD